jgi:hypothetical protein
VAVCATRTEGKQKKKGVEVLWNRVHPGNVGQSRLQWMFWKMLLLQMTRTMAEMKPPEVVVSRRQTRTLTMAKMRM